MLQEEEGEEVFRITLERLFHDQMDNLDEIRHHTITCLVKLSQHASTAPLCCVILDMHVMTGSLPGR